MTYSNRPVTDENVWMSKRTFLKGMGFAGLGAFMPTVAFGGLADRNEAYTTPRALTKEADKLTYNNYYEFGTGKSMWRSAQGFDISNWELSVEGLVDNPAIFNIDELNRIGEEERIYNFRCVEAWSATVPWSGVPMKKLMEHVGVQSGAKYVHFLTSDRVPIYNGFGGVYEEALTIPEAANQLTMLATGLYGRPLERQSGAPVRLVVPWKYGFKYVKAISKIVFTDQPVTGTWDKLSSEYGFYANVNPAFPHRRWSQATERSLTTGDRIPTEIYNGYSEYVADLYKDIPERQLFF